MNQHTWQRAVIKIGSALIAPDGRTCSTEFLAPVAQFISQCQQVGKEIILVSSGSVAAGRQHIPVAHRPTIAEKQAMAAIGQMKMMANWQQLFCRPCAQVLLTADDLRNRTRYVNIKNTLNQLLKHGAIPIVNENDTVSVDELKVGDNDNLAAYTALVAQADTLIICSDIDGLYTADPRKHSGATRIERVDHISEAIMKLAGGAGSSVGTGGMVTKLQAARICTSSGITTCIVNGRRQAVFNTLLTNNPDGTLFSASGSPAQARKLWLQHTVTVRGALHIDSGAMDALVQHGASLLAKGVVGVTGDFQSGDAVEIYASGKLLGKGLTNYTSKDLLTIKGLSSGDFEAALGFSRGAEVVHRDDMALTGISLKKNQIDALQGGN